MSNGGELAVGLLHDVGLGNDGNMLLAVVAGIFKSCPGNAAGTLIGGNLKVHCQTGQFNAPAAQNIFTLGILPEEHPVDVLFRDTDRTAVGIQVQFPAHGHVGRLHGTAVGRGGGALQQYVTEFDLGQNLIGDRFATSFPIFNGKTFDIVQLNGTGCNFLSQQLLQNTGSLSGDDGADTVTVNDTNGNLLLGGEVGLLLVHACDPVQLFFQQLHKGAAGLGHFKHYSPPSLV